APASRRAAGAAGGGRTRRALRCRACAAVSGSPAARNSPRGRGGGDDDRPRRHHSARGLRTAGNRRSGTTSEIGYDVSPMTSRDDRIKLLHEAARERILVKDGPQGTYLQGRDLHASDYGGAQYEGCPEQLNLTRPDVIAEMYRGYLDAGCDLIETNTFGGMSVVLAEYGLEAKVA